jgi:undecaprenyl-diphosphatase
MSVRATRSVGVFEPGRQAGPRHVLFLVGEAIVLLLLLALAVVVRSHPGPLPGDAAVEVDVQRALLYRGPMTGGLEMISTLNWPVPTIVTLAAITVVFLFLRRWLDIIVVLVVAGISSVATLALSDWVQRPRPSGHGVHPLQHITSTYSFPSGHVTYAVGVLGLFLFLTWQVRRPVHPWLVWLVRVVLVVVIVLMPVSRVLEAEHWPSDVLAGALDGLFWLVLFAHLYLFARSRWPVLLARDER